MTNRNTEIHRKKDANRDPITGTPGSHPVGTGVGAAAGGIAGGIGAGALAGSVAGPVGTVIGAAVGRGRRTGWQRCSRSGRSDG